IAFQRRNSIANAVYQDFSAAAGNRTEPGLLEPRNHLAQRHSEQLREMLQLRRTEPVNVDVRIFFADVPEQIQIPLERQLRMVPALHQDLNPAGRGKFVEFLVELLAAQNVMVRVFFGPIKSAELAVNVA